MRLVYKLSLFFAIFLFQCDHYYYYKTFIHTEEFTPDQSVFSQLPVGYYQYILTEKLRCNVPYDEITQNIKSVSLYSDFEHHICSVDHIDRCVLMTSSSIKNVNMVAVEFELTHDANIKCWMRIKYSYCMNPVTNIKFLYVVCAGTLIVVIVATFMGILTN